MSVDPKPVYRPGWRAYVVLVTFWTVMGLITTGCWVVVAKVTG